MVKRCVVYGCGNSCKTGNTVHEFPKNPTIRRQWISFVRVKRANFATPAENSQAVICEAHFDDRCYSTEVLRMAELSGFTVKKRKSLVPGSVPTIHPEQCTPKRQSPEDSEAATTHASGSVRVASLSTHAQSQPKKRRTCAKLEVARVGTLLN